VKVPVERSTRVVLEGKDPNGEPLRVELDEYGSRVVQHELDHLDGVLIIDRTDDEHRKEALATLRPRAVLR
jgi:peptide deformylase